MSHPTVALTVQHRNRFQLLVERLLPWYDPEREAASRAKSADLIRKATVQSRYSVRVRDNYVRAARRLSR